MNTTPWRARARRTLAVLTTAALAGGLLVTGAAAAAPSEPTWDVVSGSAQWGVKQSFREYLETPGAHGETEVVEPATQLADGTFEFADAAGTVEGTTAEITFAGEVTFRAHDGVLDTTFANPRVRIDGAEGVLVVDATAREFPGGAPREPQESPDVVLAEIDLSATPLTLSDGVASLTEAPLTLAESGVAAFGGSYDAGEALDPLSFSVQLTPAAVAPQVTDHPQDLTVEEGSDAVFTAAATGTPEPSVQWQTRTPEGEWQDAPEATGVELTLPAVTAAQDGTQVRAVFTNGSVDATTEVAVLSVERALEPEQPEPTVEPEQPEPTVEPEQPEPTVEPEQPVSWEPSIEVFAADGVTPLADTELTYGDTVVVRGAGFDPEGNAGGRGAPIPAGLPQGTYVVFGKFADQWQPSQGAPSSSRVVGAQQWALAEDVLLQVPERFQPAIRDQWVPIEDDGSFTATLTLGGVDQDWPETGSFGVYTYGAGGVDNADQELAVPLSFVPHPRIEVLATDGTPVGDSQLAEGDTVVVKGTGFDPAGNVGSERPPIQGDLPQGTYVVLGKFAEEWRPSQGAPSSARVVGDQRWALGQDVLDEVPPPFQDIIRAQWVALEDDGSFTAELEVKRPTDRGGVVQEWPEDGIFGVYTYAAGGAVNPDQELRVPLNVVEERTPQLTVTPTEDLSVGTVVSVTGTGYAPNRQISVAFTPNTVKHEEYGWPVGWLQHEVVTTDALGSFTRDITIHGWVTGTDDDCSEIQCYLATFSSAQVQDAAPVDHRSDRSQDVFVPVTFVAGAVEPAPQPGAVTVAARPDPVQHGHDLTVTGSGLEAGTDVSVQLEPSTAPAAGHLDWGVKASFRSYLASPIAHGEVTVSEEVTVNEDGSFRFPATLASRDAGAGTALLSFAGSVAFQGHADDQGIPAMDILLTNLRVQVTPESAVLVADATSREFTGLTGTGEPVTYDDVAIAELDRQAFVLGATDITAEASPATLPAAGVPAFGTFYDEGEALDPVTLAVSTGGAAAAALTLGDSGATDLGTHPVSDDGTLEVTWTVPGDFPIGGYAVVLRDAAGAFLGSDALTVTVAAPDNPTQPPGEQPGEPVEPGRGSVVVEPDPVRQGAGASFVGTDLTPGTEVAAVVDAAGAPGTLEWGIKDSFRSYLTGAIATGSVTPLAPATATGTGTYVFSEGTGSGDALDATAHFAGAVAFAGHEIRGTYALEVTIADPSIVIEDGAGYLVADVIAREFVDTSSTGEMTETTDVRLATLDLSAGAVQVVDGRLVGTGVPAVLTAEGVPAFADFYQAGDQLDPVTFSVPVGDGTELDLTRFDTAPATVGEDGTVELTWTVPSDAALGTHTVHLVTEVPDAGPVVVADASFTVVAAAAGGSGDGPAGGTGAAAPAAPLAKTGADVGALAALSVGVLLLGAAAVATRRRATA